VPWERSSAEAQEVYDIRLDRPAYGDDILHDACAHILAQKRKLDRWLESDDPDVVANCLLILIGRVINMLNHQLESQGETFRQEGGFREKLTGIRLAARTDQQGAPTCPDCGKPMTRRHARSGKHAGQDFWGCTGYPDCQGIRQISK